MPVAGTEQGWFTALKTCWSRDNCFIALECVLDSEWAVHWCLVKASDLLYFWPHPSTTHVNTFFSAVCRWVFWCLLKWSFLPKALLHISHLWGRTPVWMRLCRVSSSLRANRLSQPSKLHWNGFSPVWIRKWPCSCPLLLHRISHRGHGYFFFLVLLFKFGTPHTANFSADSSLTCKTGADFIFFDDWSEDGDLVQIEGIIVWASAQKLIEETWTLIGGGGVVLKEVVKPSGPTDCFQNPVEVPNSGGWKTCGREGSEGAWNRIVGLNTRKSPRLFCAACMAWTVRSNKTHEMCRGWQDGIDIGVRWGDKRPITVLVLSQIVNEDDKLKLGVIGGMS